MALAQNKDANTYFGRLTHLKKLFWAYFLLLIFEGALRKWVVPQFSAPLLIIRDPLAIMIIFEAYRTNKWPQRWSAMVAILTVLFVGLFVVQIVQGNPFLVGLYGLRSYLLPFPVLFIMGENLDQEDIRKLGTCTLWLLLPMTFLELAQYVSPAGSFLNQGAYEGSRQIDYTGGHARASGTFSFVVGAEGFADMAAVFIAYGLLTPGFAKRWILWAGAFALIVSLPMMGSRGVVYELALMIGCMAIGAMTGVSQFVKLLSILLPVILVAFLASLLPVFSDAMQSMTQRFSGATASEGGGDVGQTVFNRVFQPPIDGIGRSLDSDNWMGAGLGRSSAAMQVFMAGSGDVVYAEDEISREFLEMGPIAGTGFELIKVFLAISIVLGAFSRARENESLALLLVPLALVALMLTTPEQPTEEGFMVMGMALVIAASKKGEYAAGPATIHPLLQRQAAFRRRLSRTWM